MSVIDITESVFADYAAWAPWCPNGVGELADKTVYAKRSQCVQFDKAIGTSCSACGPKKVCLPGSTIKGNPATPRPWAPTHLVLADHNGAFRPTQAQVRYTKTAWP